jgi:hypothetical protein
MAKQLPPHHDRGDGVCDYCYTEWPCGYVSGNYDTQRAGDYEMELRDRKRELEMEKYNRQAELIGEACKIVGVENPLEGAYRRWGLPSSVHIPLETFQLLLVKAMGNEPPTQEELEEAERELAASDADSGGLFD